MTPTEEQLEIVKQEFMRFLTVCTPEQRGRVKAAIEEGRIDGSKPYLGQLWNNTTCGCLFAHASQALATDTQDVIFNILWNWREKVHDPNGSYTIDRNVLSDTVALEDFIAFVIPGSTPQNSPRLEKLLEWWGEWEEENCYDPGADGCTICDAAKKFSCANCRAGSI